jgi:hypothetical protein
MHRRQPVVNEKDPFGAELYLALPDLHRDLSLVAECVSICFSTV